MDGDQKALLKARDNRLDMTVRRISERASLVSRTIKPDSGIEFTRYRGFIAGFILAVFVMVILPLLVLTAAGILRGGIL